MELKAISQQVRYFLALSDMNCSAIEKKPKPLVLSVSKELLSIDMFTHDIRALANTLIRANIHFEKKQKHIQLFMKHIFFLDMLS